MIKKITRFIILLFFGYTKLLPIETEPNFDEAKLLSIIYSKKDDNIRLDSYLKLCRYYVETLNINANVFLQDAILLAKQLDNKSAIIEGNLLYARYYYHQGDIEESTYKIKDAIVVNEGLHSNKWNAEIYFQLGENYRVSGALDLAYENFQKSLDFAQKIRDSLLISSLYNRKAVYYFENSELLPEISRDSSLYYANLSMELCKRTNNIRFIIANYNVLGLIYRYKLNNLDTAQQLLYRAMEIAEKNNRIIQLPNIYYNIARGYFINLQLDSAKKYIDKGFEISDKYQINETKYLFYNLYSNYYLYLNDYKKAYEYLNLYVEGYKKSHEQKASFKVKSAFNELQFRSKELELERQRQTRNFLLTISVLVILFFIFILIVLYMRNKHITQSNIKLLEQNKLIECSNLELDKQNRIITEQNQKLEETNASKDKLFSIISHDLKNPIAGLKEMITVLADNFDSFSEEEKKEILHELKSSSENVLELLLGLLTWSRSQRNKIEYDPYEQDIYQLVYQNIAIVSTNAKNKNISIINSVAENTIAFFDANMINTVLRNLLTNAIKFTNPGGKIEVKAEQYQNDPSYILVSVADQGIGIPQDKLDKLFQIKHSFTTVGTSGEKGTGLGLLIVWDFIEKNHGKIWVESKVGEGTTFYFTLPIKEPNI
mgnify:CR=1 FL=1